MRPSRPSSYLRSAELSLTGLLIAATAVVPARADSTAAHKAAGYLTSGQAASGAFYGDGARADSVLEAAAAVSAAGGARAAVDRAVAYAASRADVGMTRGGQFGRSALALVTLARDPRSFGGVDHIARIESGRDGATGAYDPNVYGHVIAVLGITASGASPHPSAVRYLEIAQCPDGGFSAAVGCTQPSDADTTGIAINALRLVGRPVDNTAVKRAVEFLGGEQNDDGGWPNAVSPDSNPNSTALAIVGLVSAGEDPASARWAPQGRDASGALASMQAADGSFHYAGRPNAYATVQAISGLLGRAFPLHASPTSEDSSVPSRGVETIGVGAPPAVQDAVTTPDLPIAGPQETTGGAQISLGAAAAPPSTAGPAPWGPGPWAVFALFMILGVGVGAFRVWWSR